MVSQKNNSMTSKDDTREREELVNNIKKMLLDKKLEKLILELVDESEINDTLREIISKVLNLYADMLDKEAEILAYEAKMDMVALEKVKGENFERACPEELKEIEQLKKMKKQITDEINKQIIEFKVKANKTQRE